MKSASMIVWSLVFSVVFCSIQWLDERYADIGDWAGKGPRCPSRDCQVAFGDRSFEQLRGTSGDGTTEDYCERGDKVLCAYSPPIWEDWYWTGVAPSCPGRSRCDLCEPGYECIAYDKAGDTVWCGSGKKALCVRFVKRRLGEETQEKEEANVYSKALLREARVAGYNTGKVIAINNVVLGVTDSGTLNAPWSASTGNYAGGFTFPATDPAGYNVVGMRPKDKLNAYSTEPGFPAEGWGALIETSAGDYNVWGNPEYGTPLGESESFTFATDGTSAKSVWVDSTASPGIRVTHDFRESALSEKAVRVKVQIENASPFDATNVRYRRAMDWDIYPTSFQSTVTIQTGTATNLRSWTNNGFAQTNIAAYPDFTTVRFNTRSYYYIDQDLDHFGVYDQGSTFDFEFGSLLSGESVFFDIYYGLGQDEAEVLQALQDIGAEVYSLGQRQTHPTTELTFFFAFAGVGGAPVISQSPTSPSAPPSRIPTATPSAKPTRSPTDSPTQAPSAEPTRSPTYSSVLSRHEFGMTFDCANELFDFGLGQRNSWILSVADILGFMGDVRTIQTLAARIENGSLPVPYRDWGVNTIIDYPTPEAANISSILAALPSFPFELFSRLNTQYRQSWRDCAGDFVDQEVRASPGAGIDYTSAPTGDISGFTLEPSKNPTETPTAAPTESPSDAPSPQPTDEPTPSPTDSPTTDPSAAPTGTPSGAPTTAPSGSPVESVCAKPYVAISSPHPNCGEKKKNKGSKKGKRRRSLLGSSSDEGSNNPYKCGELPVQKVTNGRTKRDTVPLEVNECCSGWEIGTVSLTNIEEDEELEVTIEMDSAWEVEAIRIFYRLPEESGESSDSEEVNYGYHFIDSPEPTEYRGENEDRNTYIFTYDDDVADEANRGGVLVKACIKEGYDFEIGNTQETLPFESAAAVHLSLLSSARAAVLFSFVFLFAV